MKDHFSPKTRKWLIFLTMVFEAVLMVGTVAGLLSRGATESAVETVIILMLIFVPVLLLTLMVVLLFGKKEKTKIRMVSQPAAPAAAEKPAAQKKEESESRFCMLTKLEQDKAKFQKNNHNNAVTLEWFCEDFRNFTAYQLHLYYDIDDIRRFVAGMAVSKILILQGMSGTGKTSLAHAFGEFVSNRATVVPVQPMWKERSDLIGYYNEFTRRFNETVLLEKMYEANYSKDMYVTVLDEMNIARVEYYFAEFLSLLELPNPEERYLTVVADAWDNDPAGLTDGQIKLPVNMWFIGTANNDDSTFAISDKVYDRAMVLDLDRKCERFVVPKTEALPITAEHFEKLTRLAMEEYALSARNKNRLAQLDAYLMEHFHISFGNRIMKQINSYIPVFIACGGDELVALDDILAKKVIRKLETQNPIYLRNAAEGLLAYLDELFGADNMRACRTVIQKLQRNA